MTASLIQSFMVGQMILFSAPSYNGPDWLTEFGASRTQHAIHRSAQFGTMEDSTRLHQCKYSKAVGSARLGFEPSKMGTHSLCSGAVMEMYLAGVPVYTIMLIGRWLSKAFLGYIRKQVEQFSRHVAKQMLTFRSF
jgi:hypothetical protein